MKADIIAQMTALLGAGRFAKSDFEKYDIPALADYEGEFFWLTRENGTTLVKLGYELFDTYAKNESWRIAWFKDFLAPIYALKYYCEESRIFYYDKTELREVVWCDVVRIFTDAYHIAYQYLRSLHKDEVNVGGKLLHIKIKCPVEYLKEQLRYADALGDTSLRNCLHSLRRWNRCAVNQHVEIYGDFAKHSFTFAEVINGETHIFGGIIYSEYSSPRRWSIHT